MKVNSVKISIIYVYYNSFEEIEKSIKTVIETVDNISYEIIVVVNGDEDNRASQLISLNQEIKLIRSPKNIGFGRANNLGFKNSNGELILILNPDTLLQQDSIKELVSVLEGDDDIGITNCMIYSEQNKIQKTVIYKKYDPVYLILEYFFINKIPILKNLVSNYFYDDKDYHEVQFPSVISGSFMLIRKEIYEQLGGFDEDFFMYSEDHNICLRANKITKIMYNPVVYIVHTGAHSMGQYPNLQKLSLMLESMLLNIRKIFGRKNTFIFEIFLIINAIIFFPLSFILPNKTHKALLQIRSKLIIKKLIFNEKFIP